MDQVMPGTAQEKTDRREFFRAAARYAFLTVLTAGGIAEARRGLDGKCANQGICGTCGQFPGCDLPAALSAKKARLPAKTSERSVSEWLALRQARRAQASERSQG